MTNRPSTSSVSHDPYSPPAGGASHRGETNRLTAGDIVGASRADTAVDKAKIIRTAARRVGFVVLAGLFGLCAYMPREFGLLLGIVSLGILIGSLGYSIAKGSRLVVTVFAGILAAALFEVMAVPVVMVVLLATVLVRAARRRWAEVLAGSSVLVACLAVLLIQEPVKHTRFRVAIAQGQKIVKALERYRVELSRSRSMRSSRTTSWRSRLRVWLGAVTLSIAAQASSTS